MAFPDHFKLFIPNHILKLQVRSSFPSVPQTTPMMMMAAAVFSRGQKLIVIFHGRRGILGRLDYINAEIRRLEHAPADY